MQHDPTSDQPADPAPAARQVGTFVALALARTRGDLDAALVLLDDVDGLIARINEALRRVNDGDGLARLDKAVTELEASRIAQRAILDAQAVLAGGENLG